MRFIRFVFFLVMVFVSASCMDGKFGALGGAACPALGSGDPMQMSFSANAKANAEVRAFVAATKDLMQASIQMEGLATTACKNMGRDLGIPDAAMAPKNDEPGAAAKAACGALSAQVDWILKQGIQIQVQAQPPMCQADFQAKASCEGQCNVQVDPGQIVAQCEPARLSGYCQGTCEGRCEGRCNGTCNGQCSAVDAQGRCAGACNGTCTGSCDATCHAKCQGQWQAPKCEGSVQGPSASGECQASCNARASLRAQCTPGQVNVNVSQNAEMAMRLAATLRANLPYLIQAEVGLGKRVLGDVKVVVDVGGRLPKIIGNAGAQAVACVAAAAHASVQASVRINVSVQASASVSGRVGAGT
ncbi:MAG: hypothetical protein HS104_26385 [Polyangiaceae bacterium]|nr:hypothetical protein [Polyangiaceae bacterium]MCE7893677.1 hypothetical protein [Sorangiineae bacterium PRO1]